MKLKKIDKKLLNYLQFEFPLQERPFSAIAKKLGISEKETIERTAILKKKGIIKYIGPILNLSKFKFESTLIAASVPETILDKAVKYINSLNNVSHNYLRDDSQYNLWFTLTAPKGEISRLITEIKKRTGIKKMLNLKKEKVFKLDTRFKL